MISAYRCDPATADAEFLLAKRQYATDVFNGLSEKIKRVETRMKEISELQKHISNYSRTREVYVEYRKAGYSKKFLAEHGGEILLHLRLIRQ